MSNVTEELIDKAKSGDRNAMLQLANSYGQAAAEDSQNIVKALEYWKKAANLGCLVSQFRLAEHFVGNSDGYNAAYWGTYAYENAMAQEGNIHPSYIAGSAGHLVIAYFILQEKNKAKYYADIILANEKYLDIMCDVLSTLTKENILNFYKNIESIIANNIASEKIPKNQNLNSQELDSRSKKFEEHDESSSLLTDKPTKWVIEPTENKSVVDVEYYVKGNNKLRVETGWRWASYYVYTEDNNPPKFESHANIYDFGYKVELIETFDNCWTENDDSECDEESQEWLSEFLEDNSVFDLESEGWDLEDTETYFTCDFDIKPA